MLEVDVEGGEVVESEAVDLGNVVFVAGQSAGRRRAGEGDVFHKPIRVSL